MTISTAAAAISGYLAKTFKESKSVANFLSDFTDAAVAWIRPIFLKDDGTEKIAVKELQQNPDDKVIQDKVKALIENKAEDNDKALPILQEMMKIISEKMGQPLISNQNTSNVTGNNNLVIQGSNNNTINANTTTQHHSGTGDNVAGDKIVKG